MPAQQILSPAASTAGGWKILEVKGNNVEKEFPFCARNTHSQKLSTMQEKMRIWGAYSNTQQSQWKYFLIISVGPAEEKVVLKKSFNLKLLETKSVQIATSVVFGRIDWEEEADKSRVSNTTPPPQKKNKKQKKTIVFFVTIWNCSIMLSIPWPGEAWYQLGLCRLAGVTTKVWSCFYSIASKGGQNT